MSKFIPIILASGFISFLATPLFRRLAFSINFVDNPKARKMHITPMPMLGGVAMYVGIVGAALLSGFSSYNELAGVLGGATVVTLVGLWDDRAELPPLVKMGGQVLGAALLILSGIQVRLFGSQIPDIALTIFWIIGISNAINFLDNMDGLAAGTAMIASGFFFVLALMEGLGLVATLAAAMFGACIGFLYYNFNPASLFMGDAGSLLLGFILAVLGIKLEFLFQPRTITWMIPIIVLGVPIFDTTLIVISRLRRRRPIWQGGKDHTSHRLVARLGMTQARAVMTLYLVSGALGLIGLTLRDATLIQSRWILVGLSVAFVAALVWLDWGFEIAPPGEPPAETPSSAE